MKKILWRMRDGQTIGIQEMKESHINNCINMLKRQIQDPFDVVGPEGLNGFVAHQIEEKNTTINAWVNIFSLEFKRRELPPIRISDHFELYGEMAQLFNQIMEDEKLDPMDHMDPMDFLT